MFNMDSVYLRRLYKTACTAFRMENKLVKKGGVVFVGDSITDFCNLDVYYHGLKAVNRGISGDTVEGVRGRLEESVFGLAPSLVVIHCGANNFAEGYDDVETFIIDAYRSILSQIKARLPQTKVLVQSVYPVSDVSFHNRYKFGHGHIESINEKLKALTDSLGYDYADVYSVITSGNEEFDGRYTDDGLHPNKEGYKVISQYLKPIIYDMLGKQYSLDDEKGEIEDNYEKSSIQLKEEATSFIEKILVSTLLMTIGILLCFSISAAVSITLGVILCVYGIVNIVIIIVSRRPLLSVMGIIDGVTVAIGVAFCTHDLSNVVVLLIPFIMDILGIIIFADSFVRYFLLKQGSVKRLVVFALAGGAMAALGLCFLCIGDFRLGYAKLVFGLMLNVAAVVLFAYSVIGRLKERSRI